MKSRQPTSLTNGFHKSEIPDIGPEFSPESNVSRSVTSEIIKMVDTHLFELRFFFGPGFRIYYTIKGERIIFLLTDGDKSSQKNDIVKARAIMEDPI
jgi:putative addiction module killer protein